MQRIRNLCTGMLTCILQYFQSQKDEYQGRMIELQQRLNHPIKQPKIKIQQHQIFSNISIKNHYLQHPPSVPVISSGQLQIKQNKGNRRMSNISSDSFYSINSTVLSSHSISRRTFKIVRSSGLQKKLDDHDKNDQFRQLSSQNQFNHKNSQLQGIIPKKQDQNISDQLVQWNQKQYQESKWMNDFQLSTTQKSKIQSNIFLDEAVNKLEDYYTFYFHQIDKKFIQSGKKQDKELTPSQGWLFRKSLDFKCFYHRENESIQNDDEIVMMAISFKCNTSNTVQFLKWYNSQQTQSKLFDFQKIRLVQNGINPVLQVQQYGIQLKQKLTYLLIRQIQVVKFDNDPNIQYILQLDTTFRKGKYFKNLLRFQNCQNSLVQIYCQTYGKFITKIENFYLNKFQSISKIIHKKSLKLANSKGFN